MKGLTDINGILVGHASDHTALTGCTAILCPNGAVAGVDLRGFATGTEEIGALSPSHVTSHIHAVVLAGGSAFGLEAASGVRRWLARRKIGFPTSAGVVPIVTSAILFDLPMSKGRRTPDREMGMAAAEAANDGPVAEGSVGAGTGATVGKLWGLARAMKGGIGTYTVEVAGGVRVSALAAVNALGDVLDPATGKLVAGARKDAQSRELADSAAAMRSGTVGGFRAENTTLVVVATDAALNKVQANQLAQFGSVGMVRTINPINTLSDGDVVFALSHGTKKAPLDVLGVAAAEAVSLAILRSVRLATGLGGVVGLGG